jgi:hypothetical protein
MLHSLLLTKIEIQNVQINPQQSPFCTPATGYLKTKFVIDSTFKTVSQKIKIMQNQSFSATVLVDQNPNRAFDAINNVREWWTGEPGVQGDAKKIGDEFTYRYGDLHYSKQKVVELVPGKKIVWLVTESNLSFIDNKDEWTGTQIIFDIFDSNNNKTEIVFTHAGLVPAIECYNDCSNAWSSYVTNSLKKFIAQQEVQTH